MTEDIEHRFTYHPPTDKSRELFPMLRNHAKNFALLLNDVVPKGRELALALTKLEEAVMWANAGIARAGEQLHGGEVAYGPPIEPKR